MARSIFLAVLLLLVVAASAAWAQSSATVGVRTTPQLGTFLTDPTGRTLYTFDGDTPGQSNVTGPLLAAWPAFTASGTLSLPAGVGGSLSQITRPDGTLQVAYNGLPLYFFIGDTGPNVVNGHNVEGFAVAAVGTAQSRVLLPAVHRD